MTVFPDVQTADHHILVAGRPAFTWFESGQVHVGSEGVPPEGARAVLFPGSDKLTGVIPVSAVLSESAIEQVVILGGLTAVPEMLIDTGDFVRPIWRAGTLTLVTQFARGGVLVPFESAAQIPCCGSH
ncbi:hypothetical protein Daura_44715 [Dactylosporangium aurantiacum]|uniref:Uncharacterized protein n=1 Tax=Dactylosporangium aurantiacum TaxID=35754 RepID=A0A9Q9MC26_9ACTN|nr:hypothetical protein [Dactylosporangium aurantiacum]MDG6102116.1 hypothetical protein [Dactylosporangium aurantiacum]UWZ53558.1 hypothetical protein Daura_44715 [Dactylosporangium aurantiacum]